jgi:hypothetical protein
MSTNRIFAPIPANVRAVAPEQLIEYLPSLFGQANQFYSCFISYSAKDEEFARRIHTDLRNNACAAGSRGTIQRSVTKFSGRPTQPFEQLFHAWPLGNTTDGW